jgi:hypothetical protein
MMLPLVAPLALAQAADDPVILMLATCQESMLDWTNPARQSRILKKFESTADYDIERDYYLIPRKPATLLGFRIIELSPSGLGKAPGFSVLVEGPFDTVKRTLETQTGHKLEKCNASADGARSCVHAITSERVLMLTEVKAKTLVGCSYSNQK